MPVVIFICVDQHQQALVHVIETGYIEVVWVSSWLGNAWYMVWELWWVDGGPLAASVEVYKLRRRAISGTHSDLVIVPYVAVLWLWVNYEEPSCVWRLLSPP